ncbi:MAG: site-specific DNA-methyltransferase [Finegoldia magna]|uniref:site-specific DNA-methyltransferase n=1 Tax=Bacillota TaxID=1239 RepID=UPI0015B6B92F|nr:site-specific DNA-methyltransferase [Clostridium cadaveris]NWK12134.1 site-specific DNA-methyltransferase [Clostridium cadaveris]
MSTNISKLKRDDLLNKINQIHTYIANAPQDENTGNLLTYLSELEKDVNGKKYGLVFEEHREKIDETLEENTPVLSEEKDLFIDNGGEMNFLIEGDNLASLKLLEKTHRGKIDIIYIDPPYNTNKKDFIYDDTFIDNNDCYRHSKWISFLIQRLKISRNLLSQDGIIFISIDDNEQAVLRMLSDSVFGENNFIANMVWQKKKGGSNDSRHVATEHEYILMYSKNKELLNNIFISYGESYISRYKEEDDKGRFFWDTFKRKSGKQYYAITCPDGTVLEKDKNGEPISWLRSEKRFLSDLADGEARIIKINGKWTVHFKQRQPAGYKPRSIITEYGTTSDGAAELKNLFNLSNVFSNPKPIKLIEYLLKFKKEKQITILDFFAGSGTTGHAVLKLNNEDGGNRKFILCTNNENNICRDVTYERIKRVIEKEEYNASLKYYKVDYVPISDRMYYEYADELLEHIRELVELENGVNFTGNKEIAIVLTEEELDQFIADIDNFSSCKKIYMGHDLLPSEEQESAIRAREIEINIIPDYYYKDLQEG